MRDFFISYTKSDADWAMRIVDVLEQAGHSTLIQQRDMRGNFILQMDRAMRETRRTIAVLSPAYLLSSYTPAEWAAALRRDPLSREDLLVVFRVAPCEPEGWLAQIAFTDLIDLSGDSLRKAILDRVGPPSAAPYAGAARPQPAAPYPAAEEDRQRHARVRELARAWRADWAGRADALSRAAQQARALHARGGERADAAPRALIELAAEAALAFDAIPLEALAYAVDYGLAMHRTVLGGVARSQVWLALDATDPVRLRVTEAFRRKRREADLDAEPDRIGDYTWESIARVLESALALASFDIGRLPRGQPVAALPPLVGLAGRGPLVLVDGRDDRLDLLAPLDGPTPLGSLVARPLLLQVLAAQVDHDGALAALAWDAQYLYLWRGGQARPGWEWPNPNGFAAGAFLGRTAGATVLAVDGDGDIHRIDADGQHRRVQPETRPRHLAAAALWVDGDDATHWCLLAAGRKGELVRTLPDGRSLARELWNEPLFAGPPNGPGAGWSHLVGIALGELDGFPCAVIHRDSIWGTACVFVDPLSLGTLRAPMMLTGPAGHVTDLALAGRWLIVGCVQRGPEPGPRLLSYDLRAPADPPDTLYATQGDVYRPWVLRAGRDGFTSLQLLHCFDPPAGETGRGVLLAEGPRQPARLLEGIAAGHLWRVEGD